MRRTRSLLGVLALLILGACSGERPTLVTVPTAVEHVAPTPTVAIPDRGDCATAVGAGPMALTVLAPVDDIPVPCLVVAAHHRLEVVNGLDHAVDLTVGSTPVALALQGYQVTEPAATVLAIGPNRLLDGSDTVGVVWLVDPVEDTLAGAEIGLSSIGAIELGQGPAEVTAAAGVPVPPAGSACYQTSLQGDPYSPLFTFRDDRLVVVQIFTPGPTTLSGISIGASSTDIAGAYGDRVAALPAPDGNPARQLLVFTPTNEDSQVYRLVFDLTNDRLTTMRFGATEIVTTTPGC